MQTGTEQKKSTLPPEKDIERVIDLIDRKDLVAAQQEIEGVKGHILRIERVKALDENKRLRDIIEGMKND